VLEREVAAWRAVLRQRRVSWQRERPLVLLQSCLQFGNALRLLGQLLKQPRYALLSVRVVRQVASATRFLFDAVEAMASVTTQPSPCQVDNNNGIGFSCMYSASIKTTSGGRKSAGARASGLFRPP